MSWQGKLYQPGKKQITKTIRDAFFGLLVLYLSSYFLLWQSTTYLLLRVCTMYLYTTHAFYLIFFGLLLFIISITSTTSSSYTFPIPILGMLRIMHLNIYVCTESDFEGKMALVDHHELWKKVFFIVLMKIKILSI